MSIVSDDMQDVVISLVLTIFLVVGVVLARGKRNAPHLRGDPVPPSAPTVAARLIIFSVVFCLALLVVAIELASAGVSDDLRHVIIIGGGTVAFVTLGWIVSRI
jgi:hypothetical protein